MFGWFGGKKLGRDYQNAQGEQYNIIQEIQTAK